MEIGMRLKELRKERTRLSQKELAEALSLGEYQYKSWERGAAHPSLEYCIRLADFYEVSLDYLVAGRILSQGGDTTEEKELLETWRDLSPQEKLVMQSLLVKVLRGRGKP